MDDATSENEARFSAYVEALAGVIGHVNRVGPLKDYCIGLILPGERKSVEPMAAVIAPTRASAEHQSLLHFVGQSRWSDEAVLAKVCELVLPSIESSGPIEAWIVDDTGFSKKGVHSVGVARQYCGRLGKQDNCQVAVSLSVANHTASLPIAYQLYLPEEWAGDAARRAQVHVPETIRLSRRSRKSRSSRSRPRSKPDFPQALCWRTRVMASMRSFALALPRSVSPMSLECNPR